MHEYTLWLLKDIGHGIILFVNARLGHLGK